MKRIFQVARADYRADIDGLRALAVLAVLVNHLDPRLLSGGFVGVDVFFVISGYLITRVVVQQVADGTFSFAAFYERRIRRLFPALFAVLMLTLAVGWSRLLPSDYLALFRATLSVTVFSSNMLFWRELQRGYFADDAQLNPLLHTWSLAVEEQYYLAFPLLVLLTVRLGRGRVGQVLCAVALVSFAASAIFLDQKPVAVFFLTPFRAWELLLGGVLTFAWVPSLLGRRLLREAVAGVGGLAVIASFALFTEEMSFPGPAALVPVLGAAAILHAGAGGSTLVSRILRSRPLVYVGLISYSLYLWHWPLIVFVRFSTGGESFSLPLFMGLGVLSIGLGAASYHLIEQPFRHGFRAPRLVVFSVAAAVSLILAVTSVVGISRSGFETRVDSARLAFDRARSPAIPFLECDDRGFDSACSLGASEASPVALVWGDSHALAWAPAFDAVFRERGERAVLLADSSCPPIDGASVGLQRHCEASMAEGLQYLEENPSVRIVVLAARWPVYFREEGEFLRGYPSRDAATRALSATVEFLLDRGLHVIVLGPVPTYELSVPLGLALNGRLPSKSTNSDLHRKSHAFFFDALQSLTSSPRLELLDPMDWLCGATCKVHEGEVSWYRDANHLSVEGAMALRAHLDAAIGRSLARDEDASVAAEAP